MNEEAGLWHKASAAFEPGALSVSQAVALIRETLEEEERLANVLVKGEISNLKRHPSGHMYFTLKDDKARLRAVMFRGRNLRLQFAPADGMQVIAEGSISIYEAAGDCQLYVEALYPAGVGGLYLAFQQLKEKLEREGLFDPARKRPLPRLPRRVAVVTSPTGAAVRDVITVSRRRFPNVNLVVVPAIVQGEEGPESVVAALAAAAGVEGVDVIIVGRGGGSLEELWTFNDERVARAIYACPIPVVSAVGHETDYTIADFVADLRAPTPSAAAELVVPDKRQLLQSLDGLTQRSERVVRQVLGSWREAVRQLAHRPVLERPEEFFLRRRQSLDSAMLRLAGQVGALAGGKKTALARLCGKLDALSPLGTLARGYAICRRASDGTVVYDEHDVRAGEEVRVTLARGELACQVENKGA